MAAGDVVVTQIKTRSKSGAFFPCENVVTRYLSLIVMIPIHMLACSS